MLSKRKLQEKNGLPYYTWEIEIDMEQVMNVVEILPTKRNQYLNKTMIFKFL